MESTWPDPEVAKFSMAFRERTFLIPQKPLLFPVSLVLLVLTSLLAWSQGITTGSIRGRLLTPDNQAAQRISLDLKNTATQVHLLRATSQDGTFVFASIPIGDYTLHIEAPGFLPLEQAHLRVQAGETTSIGSLQLQFETEEVIEVKEKPTRAPREEAQTSLTFTAAMLEDLPLLNQFSKLADLIPGTVATQVENFSVPAYIARLQSGNFSVNGRSLRSNNFQIDGQANNDNTVGGQQIELSNEDALEEVEVITNNFRAQYGRGTGALVNLITRSGTNQYHGSAFEYYTGSWLSSLQNAQKNPVFGYCTALQDPTVDSCTRPVVPRSVTNEFGGTIGGPILRRKLWAFGGTDWLLTRNGRTLASSQPYVTPTPAGLKALAEYAGTNSALASLQKYGPYAIAEGNPHPLGKAFNALVSVNGTRRSIEFAPVARSTQTRLDDQQHVGRLDWQPNDEDHFFLRYLYQGELQSPGGGSVATGSFVNTSRTGHAVTADWTHAFSPTLVNQLRYSFQQTKLNLEGGAVPSCLVTAPSDCPAQIIINGSVQGSKHAGYGYLNYYPQGRTMKTNQVQDNVTWNFGNHTLTAGVEYDYQNSPSTTLPYYDGSFTFSSFGSFLSSSGTLRLADGSLVKRFTEQDAAAYISDDFRLLPSFTLSLGLRWEFYENPVNVLHDLTMARETSATHLWSTAIALDKRTFPAIGNYYKNFEPRVGFAWTPSPLEGRMVVRGGYSIGVDPALYAIYLDAATSAPVVNLGSISCGGTCLPSSGTDGAAVRALNLPSLPVHVNPNSRDQTQVATNLRQPYAQFYSLGLEYQMLPAITFSAGYVGDHSVHDLQSLNGNPLLSSVASDFPQLAIPDLCSTKGQIGLGRLDCSRSLVRTRANTAFSIYNSAVVGLKLESYHGISAIAAYTFGKTIDNASEIFSAGQGGNTDAFAENPLDTNIKERGISSYSYPHIVSTGINWEIPLLQNQTNNLSRWLGGWSLNAIYAYHSGQAFTPFQQVTSTLSDTGYCDSTFDSAFNVISTATGAISDCRPVLSNSRAPLDAVGILVNSTQAKNLTAQGTEGYYLYNATDTDKKSANYGKLNQPVDASSVHWLWNNRNIANTKGTPFPGVSRNTLRGRPYNNLDASLYKTIPLTEHTNLQLRAIAANLLNYQYIQVPDNNLEDSNPLAGINPFLSTAYLTSNNRTVELGLRLSF